MLTYTEFSGSPYHLGLVLGKFGAQAVQDALIASPQWDTVMQWRDSDLLRSLQEQVQQHHPYIWDELQGLARGLELPPDDVFLWNCRDDLPLTEQDGDPASIINASTTIMMPTDEGPRIRHDQYVPTALAHHCGIAEFHVDQGPHYAALVCPGELPGHHLSVTDHGMAIAVNGIPEYQPAGGVPGVVLTRALLTMSDLSGAVQWLNESSRSGALHVALTQRGGSALLSVELSAQNMSIRQVKAHTEHSNALIHETMLDDSHTGKQAIGHTGQTRVAIIDVLAGSDAVHWDVYEDPDDAVRFRLRDARHI